jgi:hypothetical protein
MLHTDDDGYSVRATTMHATDGEMLLVRAWLNYTGYTYVVIDDHARIVASITGGEGTSHRDTDALIREELDRKGIELTDAEEYSLLADHADDGRRTSVVKDDWGPWSMRVKTIEEDDTYSQIRIEHVELGFVHLVLTSDGAIVAFATGRTDSDAWSRVQGELGRRGVVLD